MICFSAWTSFSLIGSKKSLKCRWHNRKTISYNNSTKDKQSLGRDSVGHSSVLLTKTPTGRVPKSYSGMFLLDLCFASDDIDVTLSYWCDLFLSAIDAHVPKRNTRNTYDHPWLDTQLLNLIKKKISKETRPKNQVWSKTRSNFKTLGALPNR